VSTKALKIGDGLHSDRPLIFSVTPAVLRLVVIIKDAKRLGVGHARTIHAGTAWKRGRRAWLS
jgi:hypothetical protein